MKRQTFLRSSLKGLALCCAAPVLTTVGTAGGVGTGVARAVPIIGRAGLVMNASSLAEYVRSAYPGVLSIGGVRSDPLPDHPSGHAIDIMVGGNSGLGNQIYGDIMSQQRNFGVKYSLWQVPAHYDHIHVTVF